MPSVATVKITPKTIKEGIKTMYLHPEAYSSKEDKVSVIYSAMFEVLSMEAEALRDLK
jgi:hypothetical protein